MHHICWSIRFNIRFIRSNEQSFLVLWNLSASSVFWKNGIALHLPSTHMPFLRWTLVSHLLTYSLDHTNELVNSFRRSEQANFFCCLYSLLRFRFMSFCKHRLVWFCLYLCGILSASSLFSVCLNHFSLSFIISKQIAFDPNVTAGGSLTLMPCW